MDPEWNRLNGAHQERRLVLLAEYGDDRVQRGGELDRDQEDQSEEYPAANYSDNVTVLAQEADQHADRAAENGHQHNYPLNREYCPDRDPRGTGRNEQEGRRHGHQNNGVHDCGG